MDIDYEKIFILRKYEVKEDISELFNEKIDSLVTEGYLAIYKNKNNSKLYITKEGKRYIHSAHHTEKGISWAISVGYFDLLTIYDFRSLIADANRITQYILKQASAAANNFSAQRRG